MRKKIFFWMICIIIFFVLLIFAACSNNNVPEKPYQKMYLEIVNHLMTEECINGNWEKDFGDSSMYGQSFFILEGIDKKNPDFIEQGFLVTNFINTLIEAWKQNPALFLEKGDDLLMGTLGLFDTYENFDAACKLLDEKGHGCHEIIGDLTKEKLKENIEYSTGKWNELTMSFNYYMPDMDIYAINTYGNTVVSALFGILNIENARIFSTEQSTDKIEVVKKIIDSIDQNAYDENLKAYRYKPSDKKLYLYPNTVMMLLYGRLYKLTKDEIYLNKSKALYEAIQPLKDKEKGSYHSPYSQIVMGAKTDDYKTLSSQNHTILALMTLYENTGEEKWLNEVKEILNFIETHLYKDGMALHHWMDGEFAKPEHLEYYCTGCNLQLLYVIRHFWNL